MIVDFRLLIENPTSPDASWVSISNQKSTIINGL